MAVRIRSLIRCAIAFFVTLLLLSNVTVISARETGPIESKKMSEMQKTFLTADIEKMIAACDPKAHVCVAFHDLATGDELRLRADEKQHPASTIKLAVMAELFHQAQQGTLSLDDRLTITNTFKSLADGSPYTLEDSDDSETTLYSRIGQTETLHELAWLMIVRSSNLATNLLTDRLGAANATAFMKSLGADDLVVARGVQDQKAFNLGMNNVASAQGLCTLLTKLAKRELVSPNASDAMIKILLGQELTYGIPAGVPKGVRVANKTGSITAVNHDAGIVFPQDGRAPYVLVILTRGIADANDSHALIAAISKRVYQAVTGTQTAAK